MTGRRFFFQPSRFDEIVDRDGEVFAGGMRKRGLQGRALSPLLKREAVVHDTFTYPLVV